MKNVCKLLCLTGLMFSCSGSFSKQQLEKSPLTVPFKLTYYSIHDDTIVFTLTNFTQKSFLLFEDNFNQKRINFSMKDVCNGVYIPSGMPHMSVMSFGHNRDDMIILPPQGMYSFSLDVNKGGELIKNVRFWVRYAELIPFLKGLNAHSPRIGVTEEVYTAHEEVPKKDIYDLPRQDNNDTPLVNLSERAISLINISRSRIDVAGNSIVLNVSTSGEKEVLVPMLPDGLSGVLEYISLDGKIERCNLNFSQRLSSRLKVQHLYGKSHGDCCASRSVEVKLPLNLKSISQLIVYATYLPLPLDSKFDSVESIMEAFAKNRQKYKVELHPVDRAIIELQEREDEFQRSQEEIQIP